MKILKNILAVVLIIVLLVILGFLGYGIFNKFVVKTQNPVVTFEIENHGSVKIELYPEVAPNTVANFIKLAQSGFYEGKVIYGKDSLCLYVGRAEDGTVPNPTVSMIDSNVEKGSEKDIEYQIKGEFVANGFEQNDLSHEEGVLSMIRYDYTQQIPDLVEQSYNSGNSQLGLMITNARDLNGLYAAFGKVTEGMEIFKKIADESSIKKVEDEAASTGIDEFETKPVIKSVTVETYGKDYGIPEYEEYFDYQEYLTEMLSQYYSTNENE